MTGQTLVPASNSNIDKMSIASWLGGSFLGKAGHRLWSLNKGLTLNQQFCANVLDSMAADNTGRVQLSRSARVRSDPPRTAPLWVKLFVSTQGLVRRHAARSSFQIGGYRKKPVPVGNLIG